LNRLPGTSKGFLLLMVALAATQPVRARERQEGLRLGRSVFYPSIEVMGRNDDNLFQETENPIEATVLEIGPDLVWRLPLSRSRFDLAYRPRFVSYENDVIPSTTTHVFDGEAEFQFRNEIVFRLRNSFEDGILEFREFTGGEPTFSGDAFTRNQFDAMLLVPLGDRQEVEFGVFNGFVEFDEPERAAFFDFDNRGVTSAWAYWLTDDLAARVQARWTRSHQERDDFVTFDLITGEPVVLEDFQEEDATEKILWPGLEGQVGQWFETRTYFGYGEMAFDDSQEQDYHGTMLRSDSRFHLGRAFEVRVLLERLPYPSNFNVANFFVAERAGLWLAWRSPRRLTIRVGGSTAKNSYKDPIVTDADYNPDTGRDPLGNEFPPDPASGFVAGVLREDEGGRIEARLEFAFIPGRLTAYVEFFDEQRTSNITFAEFDRRAATAGLRFGWLPPGSGGI
jgi:hypothetical protein